MVRTSAKAVSADTSEPLSASNLNPGSVEGPTSTSEPSNASSEATPRNSDSARGSSQKGATIAGATVGGVVLVCFFVGLAFFHLRRRQKITYSARDTRLEFSGADSRFELPDARKTADKAVRPQPHPVGLYAGEVAVEKHDETSSATIYTRRQNGFSPNSSFFNSPHGLKSPRHFSRKF